MVHRVVMAAIGFCVLLCASSGGQISTRDSSKVGPTIEVGGVAVIEPRTMAIAGASDAPGAIEPRIETVMVGELGYDLVCTYTNGGETPASLARLTVGALALGQEIRYLSVHRGSMLVEALHRSYVGQAWRYPSEAYSPVTVLMNDRVAVGVSLLYPVAEYAHDVLVSVGRAGGVFHGAEGAEGWAVWFDLSQPARVGRHTALAYPAVLAPGETRTYRVAVRVLEREGLPESATGPQDWLETLVPYREHFRSQFGGVVYERRAEPVLAFEVANGSAISATNPRGLLGDRTSRPDLAGFGPLVRHVRTFEGFPRVMLWAPSGLYSKAKEFNFPPHFTYGWKTAPLMESTHTRLRELPQSGIELGLWWGHSVQHADVWEPAELVGLDLENRHHLAVIAEQLSLAESAGATTIGLDALNHWIMPAWEQRRYIEALGRTYPSLTFVAEPAPGDLVHAVAAGFHVAFAAPEDGREEGDFHRLRTPHYLADFLLPGHESWAYFRYSEISTVWPGYISGARVQSDANRLAALGYVPVMSSAHALTDTARATGARTWERTVPEHLRDSAEEDEEGAGTTGDSSATPTGG